MPALRSAPAIDHKGALPSGFSAGNAACGSRRLTNDRAPDRTSATSCSGYARHRTGAGSEIQGQHQALLAVVATARRVYGVRRHLRRGESRSTHDAASPASRRLATHRRSGHDAHRGRPTARDRLRYARSAAGEAVAAHFRCCRPAVPAPTGIAGERLAGQAQPDHAGRRSSRLCPVSSNAVSETPVKSDGTIIALGHRRRGRTAV